MEKKILQKKIGEQIKRVRASKKVSQLDVAVACYMEVSNISRIENGNTNITVYTLHQIAKALAVSVHDLIPGDL